MKYNLENWGAIWEGSMSEGRTRKEKRKYGMCEKEA